LDTDLARELEAGVVDVDPEAVQQDGQEPELTKGEREREREWHPGEVRRDAGKREQEGAEQAWQPAQHPGVGETEPEDPAEHRRDEADLDRRPEGARDDPRREVRVVLERRVAGVVLEAADDQGQGRQEKEKEREDEEREQAQPGPAPPLAAARRARRGRALRERLRGR